MKTIKNIYCKNQELNKAVVEFLAVNNISRKDLFLLDLTVHAVSKIRWKADSYDISLKDDGVCDWVTSNLRSFYTDKISPPVDWEEISATKERISKENALKIAEINKERNKIAVVDIYNSKPTLIKTIDTSRN